MTHPPLDLEGIRKRLERDEDVIPKLIQLIQSTSDIRALLEECEILRALLAEAEKALEHVAARHWDAGYNLTGYAKAALAKIRQAKG